MSISTNRSTPKESALCTTHAQAKANCLQLPQLRLQGPLACFQDACLLVVGGRAPEAAWLREAAKGREVWAVDHGLDACLAADIRPQRLIGDGDSAAPAAWQLAKEQHIPIEQFPVEKDDTEKVLDALQDPKKHVIVQVAPSVRVSLGDAFGMEPGAIVTGQMVTALHLLGFDKVFDTNFGADLTIMEEGTEFLDRLQHGGVLPMMTSCCPGWVYYVEKHYSDCLPHLSSTKSPMSIFGAVAKTYYPKVAGIDVKDIVTVSVMPCTAKKFEAARPELGRDGRPDVDIVLTTRELIKLIKYVGLSFGQLPETEFDSPLGTASGAGAIFGTTGGVMEAALRTVCDKLTGKTLERLDFQEARGFKGIKECTLELGGRTLHIAIAHTLKNAEILMEQVRKGISPYDFIEVMACPGGCIGGGGQPIGTTNAVKKKRMQALYEIDRSLPVRKSHENPVLQVLYRDFLGEPGEGKAHELLHTGYRAVPKTYPF